jgi:hypothetical protein
MSKLYGPQHRALQDRFDMRRLADGVERRVVGTEITGTRMTTLHLCAASMQLDATRHE